MQGKALCHSLSCGAPEVRITSGRGVENRRQKTAKKTILESKIDAAGPGERPRPGQMYAATSCKENAVKKRMDSAGRKMGFDD